MTSTKGAWVIAAAIVLAAALLVGFQVYTRKQDQRCQEWQSGMRRVSEILDEPISETVQQSDSRPDGCPDP